MLFSLPFLWSTAQVSLHCTSMKAQPFCCLCMKDTSQRPWFSSQRRNMGLYERCKASKMWHLSVHLYGHTDPLPASVCLGQAQSKRRVAPKPREEPNCELQPVGLGLLHIAAVDLCFVCCGSQTRIEHVLEIFPKQKCLHFLAPRMYCVLSCPTEQCHRKLGRNFSSLHDVENIQLSCISSWETGFVCLSCLFSSRSSIILLSQNLLKYTPVLFSMQSAGLQKGWKEAFAASKPIWNLAVSILRFLSVSLGLLSRGLSLMKLSLNPRLQ